MNGQWRNRSDDFSRDRTTETKKLKMHVYLLPFGFEKADLLLGEFFKTEALAEVSLESRKRRTKNRNNKYCKRKKKRTDNVFGESTTRILTQGKYSREVGRIEQTSVSRWMPFPDVLSRLIPTLEIAKQDWLSCGFVRLKNSYNFNWDLQNIMTESVPQEKEYKQVVTR